MKTCDAKSEIKRKIYERKWCRAERNTKKRQMACQNYKIAGAMQTVSAVEGVLGAKNAQVTDESAKSEAENSDLNGQKSDKSEQKGQNKPLLKPFRGQKSDMFDREC